jgi:hypothetical protein
MKIVTAFNPRQNNFEKLWKHPDPPIRVILNKIGTYMTQKAPDRIAYINNLPVEVLQAENEITNTGCG